METDFRRPDRALSVAGARLIAKIRQRRAIYVSILAASEACKKNFPAELPKIRQAHERRQTRAVVKFKRASSRRISSTRDGPLHLPDCAPRLRTEWAYIFGAICPAKGKGAGLVIGATDPWRRTSSISALSGVPAPIGADRRFWPVGTCRPSWRSPTTTALGAATIARVEPGGECQAIQARLVVEPDLQIVQDIVSCCQSWNKRYRQSWKIMSLWHAQMGEWVLINATVCVNHAPAVDNPACIIA